MGIKYRGGVGPSEKYSSMMNTFQQMANENNLQLESPAETHRLSLISPVKDLSPEEEKDLKDELRNLRRKSMKELKGGKRRRRRKTNKRRNKKKKSKKRASKTRRR